MNLVHWKKWIAPQMAHLTDETNRAHIEAIQLNAFKCGMHYASDVDRSGECESMTEIPQSVYENPA
jgi:hypothetical protein